MIKELLDEKSFVEVDSFWGKTVKIGYGTIADRPVYIYEENGDPIDYKHMKKIAKIFDMAIKTGCPIIQIKNSRGGTLEEGIKLIEGLGEVSKKSVMASGVIPQISIILGDNLGSMVYSTALSDFTFMIKDKSRLFLNSEQIINSTNNVIENDDEFGKANFHKTETGLCQFAVEDEAECINKVRELVKYIPDNNLTDPFSGSEDELNRIEDELNNIDINEYEVRDVVKTIVDNGEFLEINEYFAENIVVGLARLGGQSVGIIANRILIREGKLDSKAINKATRFIRFCDAFNIPIITLSDIKGYMEEENTELIRSSAKLLYSYIEATVPKINLIIGKAYGSAYAVMGSSYTGADMTLAWENAIIALDNVNTMSNILYREEIISSDDVVNKRKEMVERYKEEFASAKKVAEIGGINDVIEPATTRQRLISSLYMLLSKRENRIMKKHGNMPI